MPTARPTLTIGRLERDVRDRLFARSARDRVGAEVELTPMAFDRSGAFDPASALAAASRVAEGSPPRGGLLTREPGGQIEISLAPRANPAAAARALGSAIAALRRRAARLGAALAPIGMHPWASAEELGLAISKPRYAFMQNYFDAIGPLGRRMMRQTGSVQVAVDLGADDREARQRWELAQRLAPVLAAMFANSAVERGRPAGRAGLRAEAWLGLDPRRTGLPAGFLDDPGGDPAAHYAGLALDAPVMFVVGRDGDYAEPGRAASFRSWVVEGLEAAGFPTLDDWEIHLSTLFPEVRPRGYLEIRSCDAPGEAWAGVPVLVAATALRDPAARAELLDRLRPHHDELPDLRRRAAESALADPTLRALAGSLMAAVRPRLDPAAEATVAAYDERYVQTAMTPGDELAATIAPGGRLSAESLLAIERSRMGASGFAIAPASGAAGLR